MSNRKDSVEQLNHYITLHYITLKNKVKNA